MFDRDHVGYIVVYCISHVNVSHSHQSHVLYYVLHDLAKAGNYTSIRDLLVAHEDFMCRQLTLLLRQHFTSSNTITNRRPSGLPSLLRVVLQLGLHSDQKSLRDVIAVLLRQLDISWMDTADVSLTTDILGVIAIFVTNFPSIGAADNEEDDASKSDDGAKNTNLRKLIQGNECSVSLIYVSLGLT